MSVKLAFSRPTANDSEQQLLFNYFRSEGYDGLQLKQPQFERYIRQPDLFKEQWSDWTGIGSSLITYGKLDEENRSQLREIFKFAQKIETVIVVFCHTVPRNAVSHKDIRNIAGLLSELGKEAQQRGVALSLHHHFDQPIMHREDFDVFFEHVQDDAVSLTVDTAHLVKSGITDVAQLITSFSSVINNFHLKDYVNGEWRILGHGTIDFKPIFQAIRKIRYSGWISADEESGGDIIGGMRECNAFIKNGLDPR